MSKKHGFSWSWKRAIGLSARKQKLARKIGIPLTKSGLQRKVGAAVLGPVLGRKRRRRSKKRRKK